MDKITRLPFLADVDDLDHVDLLFILAPAVVTRSC